MQLAQADSAILNRFRQALNEAYGSRLERVVLFGSATEAMRVRILITISQCLFTGCRISGANPGGRSISGQTFYMRQSR